MSNLTAQRVGSDEVGFSYLVVKPSVQTVMPPARAPMEILTRAEILRRRTQSTPAVPPLVAHNWSVEMHENDLKMLPKKRGGWPKGRPRK